MAVLAGSLFMSSCVKDDLVTFDPAGVSAQSLGNISGCALSVDGEAITTTYEVADFGIDAPVGYTLYIDAAGSAFENARKLAATIADGSISFTQKDLNNAILNLGGEADADFPVEFKLVAALLNDKGAAIEGTEVESNVVSAVFVPYNAEILDVDAYEHVWIIGAGKSVGAWNHGDVYQYLYNYTKDGSTFTGLIYYGDDAASGWKLTGIAGWQDDCNWGSPDQAEDAEPASIQLITGGGSKDIKCYSKKFYMWSFDNKSLILTKKYGFDNVGIVGTFNGWNQADANCKMEYNDFLHRFYIDYTFSEDAMLKFTCDDSWDLNWGEGCAQGAGDIAVPAGSYRVYLDLNKGEYSFNSSMFGKEEPGKPAGPDGPDEPDQPSYEGWGLIGVGGDWDHDVAMTEADGVWTGYANIAAADGFKLRKDAAWDENRGAEGETEPYVVTVGTAFKVVNNGKNLAVPADGFYQVVYNTKDETITISTGNVWGVIGQFNGWGGDSFMTLADGVWTSPAISLKAGEGFKIRYNAGWDENRGADSAEEPYVVTINAAFTAVAGGKNLAVAEDGDYKVVYDPAAETITVIPALPQNCWSLIGAIAGSSWNKDFYMSENAGVWTSNPIEIKAGDQFKIRFNNGWDENRGGNAEAEPQAFGMGESVVATPGGKNLTVKEDGTYVVVYDAAKELIYFLGWTVIGQVNGSNWNADIVMAPSEGGIWTSNAFTVEGGFKIRYGASWDVNRGAEGEVEPFNMPLGTAVKVVANGKNLGVEAPAGKYILVYNEKDETITLAAEK